MLRTLGRESLMSEASSHTSLRKIPRKLPYLILLSTWQAFMPIWECPSLENRQSRRCSQCSVQITLRFLSIELPKNGAKNSVGYEHRHGRTDAVVETHEARRLKHAGRCGTVSLARHSRMNSR